jgi:hypothetical protein
MMEDGGVHGKYDRARIDGVRRPTARPDEKKAGA